MSAQQAQQLQPGDTVSTVGNFDAAALRKVRWVKTRMFPTDPMVFFRGGGFEVASKLRLVEAVRAEEN